MSSAWEQWGTKRPANGGAQDAFQSLLRASPLAATVSSSGESGAYSLQKMWDSARDLTKNAVSGIVVAGSPANSTTSTVGSATDLEALESGQMRTNGGDASAEDAESATATWPFFRRKSNTENALLPTMSWCVHDKEKPMELVNTRFKYFVGMTLMGLMFFGMASIFLPLPLPHGRAGDAQGPRRVRCESTGAQAPAAHHGLLSDARLDAVQLLGAGQLCARRVQFDHAGTLLLTLAVFAMSALPGGNASLKAFGVVFMKAARGMLQTFARLFR